MFSYFSIFTKLFLLFTVLFIIASFVCLAKKFHGNFTRGCINGSIICLSLFNFCLTHDQIEYTRQQSITLIDKWYEEADDGTQ